MAEAEKRAVRLIREEPVPDTGFQLDTDAMVKASVEAADPSPQSEIFTMDNQPQIDTAKAAIKKHNKLVHGGRLKRFGEGVIDLLALLGETKKQEIKFGYLRPLTIKKPSKTEVADWAEKA